MNKKRVVWFNEVDKNDGNLVGGKGANLGEMVKAGFPVPPGYVVTAATYFEFLKKTGIKKEIKSLLKNLNHNDSRELQKTTKKIRNLIKKTYIPEEIAKDIFDYYHKLSFHYRGNKFNIKRLKRQLEEPLVAVRSSATAEDLPEASFAGQQETFLNVQGDANVIHYVREAWASLFTARATFYRAEKNFDHLKVGIALPIQLMIESDISGIMFTLDPITNNKKTIVIEAIRGLGELIVQGAVTPDHYLVNKSDLKIIKKQIGKQESKMILKNKKNKILKTEKKESENQKITNEQIKELAEFGRKLEKHYYFPQDIEWAIEDDKIYIVQTRPITTISDKLTNKETDSANTSYLEKELKLILEGSPASPGIISGKVVIIKEANKIHKVRGGDILVAPMTDPDFVPAMKRAAAVITDKGGRTSHAAIVSRELGIPAIVGTIKATKKLQPGSIITVNGATGKIYAGGLNPEQRKQIETSIKGPSLNKGGSKGQLKTATNIYCNLATTNRVEEISKYDVSGVGLLRAEFMIADIGYHPRYLIQQKKEKMFLDTMTKNISVFCKNFGNRPIIYRATDFKSNEYKDLKGGKLFETDEENPMIGFRGAYRYISDPAVFNLELQVVKNVRNKLGFKNLWLMIPFVRTINELQKVKKLIQEAGIHRSGSFKLWMMVEIPSNVILIDEFIKEGIDGISIGSNDLTQLTLGVGRDSEKVAEEFNELDPAVIWSIKRVIKAAAKHGITSSICGQAPSDYPDLVEKMIKWGITSVSVNPDAIDRVREHVYEVEKRLIRK